VNAPDIVTAEPEHRRYRSGETAVLQLTIAHCSRRRLDGATIAWVAPEVDLRGELRAGIVPNAAATPVGEIRFEVPPVPLPTRATVQLELRDEHGQPVNRNDVVLLLLPRGTTPGLGDRDRVHLRASDELSPSLAAGGWSVVGADGDASLFVDERWSPAMDRFVSAGGRALVLAGEEDALPDDLGLKVQRRKGTLYEGDWAQGMGWLRSSLGAGLAVGPRVDLVFLGLTPRLVLVGYDPADREDVLAGCYAGWIHATAATVGTFSRGHGAGLLSTFPLSAGYGRDPLGTALFDRLIQIAASSDLSATTRL
jgi:hypothetical protein